MSDLRDLYQEVIIDHNRNPRHRHTMDDANKKADGFNPLCGDKITLYLKVADNKIIDVSFVGDGCAISTASASLMTEALIGKTVEQAKQLFTAFHQVMLEKDEQHTHQSLGKLAVLEGVKAYPARVKCATLAWHTLQAALAQQSETACTE